MPLVIGDQQKMIGNLKAKLGAMNDRLKKLQDTYSASMGSQPRSMTEYLRDLGEEERAAINRIAPPRKITIPPMPKYREVE
jgi:hypothetical protein